VLQPYVNVMSKLQDALPPRPLSEVAETVREEFNKPLDEMFAEFHEDCLAAASIGQVHKAVMKSGVTVAVKVQHRGMDRLLSQDLFNLGSIMSWLSWAEPDLDIKSVLEEWSKEVVKELDFEHEAKNMVEVMHNMARTGFSCVVPEVIPGLYSKRVLAMRFVDGIKVSDVAALDRLGVDKVKLVHDICTAYAHQIYVDGVFNGDPHPGNIMIMKRSQLEHTGAAGWQPKARADGDDAGDNEYSVRVCVRVCVWVGVCTWDGWCCHASCACFCHVSHTWPVLGTICNVLHLGFAHTGGESYWS